VHFFFRMTQPTRLIRATSVRSGLTSRQLHPSNEFISSLLQNAVESRLSRITPPGWAAEFSRLSMTVDLGRSRWGGKEGDDEEMANKERRRGGGERRRWITASWTVLMVRRERRAHRNPSTASRHSGGVMNPPGAEEPDVYLTREDDVPRRWEEFRLLVPPGNVGRLYTGSSRQSASSFLPRHHAASDRFHLALSLAAKSLLAARP